MNLDLALAVVHHLGILTVFGVILAEFALLRLPPDPAWVRLIARIDLAYGISAGVVLLAGFSRVAWGAKGAGFYLDNPVFWLKLGLFALIGLISVLPTVQYIQWRRALDAGRGLPDGAQIATARRWVHLQLALFIGLPVFAAMMARGLGH
jgi:putative membrane protein